MDITSLYNVTSGAVRQAKKKQRDRKAGAGETG